LAFALVPLSLWAGRPVIEFKDTHHDFGILTQGATVQYSYPFANLGTAPLKIEGVHSSCGCTAAVPSNPLIAPGGREEIRVVFDSRGKMGETLKEVRVRTNDPEQPVTVLTLAGKIVASQHPEMTGPQNLFLGSCRECHVDRGVDKYGEALFAASCAMCHESLRRRGTFIAASAEDMAARPAARLRLSIANGVPDTSMPAFGEKNGGPLTRDQIRSLEKYLKSLKQ